MSAPNMKRHLTFLILTCLFAVPVKGMESEPFLDETFDSERVEVLELLVKNDEEENHPSAIYDGSRDYYDHASQKKDKIKQYVKAGKNCLKFTAFWAAATAVVSAAGWIAMDSFVYGVIVLADTIRDPNRFSLEFKDIFSVLLPWEIGVTHAIALPLIATGGYIKTIFPLHSACPRNWCLYRELDQFPLDYHIIGNETHEISPELIAHANDTIHYFDKKSDIQRLTNTDHIRFWKLKQVIFSPNRRLHKLIQKVQERLENVSPLRDEYRKLAFQVKKHLRSQLSRDTLWCIFRFFPQNNILEHVLSHHNEKFWRRDYSYLTKKEWIHLIYSYMPESHLLKIFYNVTHLSAKGWCAFAQSEKYPIRCRTAYFDENTLRHWALDAYHNGCKKLNPTIFVPYHSELAKHYKFEEDPHYAPEFENPSNEKIRRLLELRQEVIAQGNDKQHDNN